MNKIHDSREEKEKYKVEILNAGLHRGGTGSLSLALCELGYGPTWHCITNDEKMDNIQKGQEWLIKNKVCCGDYKLNNINWSEFLQIIQCKSLMDSPINYHWKSIFNQYPDCKVIVCIRPFNDWYNSWKPVISFMFSFKNRFFAFMGNKFVYNVWEFHRSYTINNGGIQYFHDETLKQKCKEIFYDHHIDKIKEIVPKDQLLLFDVKNGWKPLCEFLNKPIPQNKPFPKINDHKELMNTLDEWRSGAMKNMLINKVIPFIIIFVAIFMYFCL
eukprot:175017_1